MKTVFVPASDDLLNDENLSHPELVPFNPNYLTPKADRKPRNWITQSSYQDALNRLRSLTLQSSGNPQLVNP